MSGSNFNDQIYIEQLARWALFLTFLYPKYKSKHVFRKEHVKELKCELWACLGLCSRALRQTEQLSVFGHGKPQWSISLTQGCALRRLEGLVCDCSVREKVRQPTDSSASIHSVKEHVCVLSVQNPTQQESTKRSWPPRHAVVDVDPEPPCAAQCGQRGTLCRGNNEDWRWASLRSDQSLWAERTWRLNLSDLILSAFPLLCEAVDSRDNY